MDKKIKSEIIDLELQIKANEDRRSELEDRRSELDKLREPIEKEMVRLYEANEILRNKMDNLKISFSENDWGYILQKKHYDSSVHRNFQEEKLFEIGLSTFGFNSETEQTCIHIGMIKGDKDQFEKVMNGLNIVLPFLKDDKNGELTIHIMEESCAADGIYTLIINRKEKSFAIYINSHFRKSFNTLEAAVLYIQENLWYKKLCR